MKLQLRKIHPLLLLLIFSASLAALQSCEMKGSINGKLDGQWHLMSILDIETGVTTDKTDDDRYYNFYQHTCVLSTTGSVIDPPKTFGGNMVYDYPSLTLDFPDDNVYTLMRFGLDGNTTHFTIEKLTDHELVMRSAISVLTLYKL